MFTLKRQTSTPLIKNFQKKLLVFPNSKQPPSQITNTLNRSASQKIVFLTPKDNQRNFKVNQAYAFQLLCCQMEFQCFDDVKNALINRLIQLYKNGIQYYNLRKDKRQHYFKKKLQYLTAHPTVLEILHQNEGNSEDHFYKKKQIQRMMEMNNKNMNQNINKLLKNVQQIEKKNNQTIEDNINLQLQKIKKRIQKRKLASKIGSLKAPSQNCELQSSQAIDQLEPLPKTLKKSKARAVATFTTLLQNSGQNYDAYFVQKYIQT